LTARFDEALTFAREKHGGQLRKGTNVPYVAHLLAVASLVLEDGGDEDEAVAALLHDVVEDCGGRPVLAEVQRFGPRVAAIVDGCTDSYVEDHREKPPWQTRKEGYLARLGGQRDRSVLRVSAADKLHNARTLLSDLRAGRPHEDVWTRFNASPAQILWYYRALVAAYHAGEVGPLASELERVVNEIALLAPPAR
jgi:GTP pyrophosphokinase